MTPCGRPLSKAKRPAPATNCAPGIKSRAGIPPALNGTAICPAFPSSGPAFPSSGPAFPPSGKCRGRSSPPGSGRRRSFAAP